MCVQKAEKKLECIFLNNTAITWSNYRFVAIKCCVKKEEKSSECICDSTQEKLADAVSCERENWCLMVSCILAFCASRFHSVIYTNLLLCDTELDVLVTRKMKNEIFLLCRDLRADLNIEFWEFNGILMFKKLSLINLVLKIWNPENLII